MPRWRFSAASKDEGPSPSIETRAGDALLRMRSGYVAAGYCSFGLIAQVTLTLN